MSPNGRGSHRAIARGKSCVVAIAAALLLVSSAALAEDKEKEPAAILELGSAGAWDVNGSAFGPTAAVEFAPIKKYLVIEAGLTPFFDDGVSDHFAASITNQFLGGCGRRRYRDPATMKCRGLLAGEIGSDTTPGLNATKADRARACRSGAAC